MKSLKKYFGVIIFVLIGGVCGGLAVMEIEAMGAFDMPFWQYMIMLVGMVFILYIAFFLQIIIHEAGHLVCGLLSGYHFSSFRIGSLMWIKQNGKIRFKRFSLAGTGGQCLLLPPPLVDGKIKYVLYNLGGSLANILTALICLPLFLILGSGLFHFFFVLMFVIGVGFSLVNGIPMNSGGVTNDGYNARSLGSNPNALRAFWVQMKINESQAAGVRVKDMPEEWFLMPEKEDMSNTMCSTIAVIRTSRLMDEHDFDSAAKSIDELLEDSRENKIQVQGIYLNMMACDRIFCELMGQGDRSVIEKLLTKELTAVLKQMKNMISVIRTKYALALFYYNKPEEANRLKILFDKQAAKYPHPAEIEAEREFMEIAKEVADGITQELSDSAT